MSAEAQPSMDAATEEQEAADVGQSSTAPSAAQPSVVSVRGVAKTFFIGFFRKRVEAVRGIDFEVRRGRPGIPRIETDLLDPEQVAIAFEIRLDLIIVDHLSVG